MKRISSIVLLIEVCFSAIPSNESSAQTLNEKIPSAPAAISGEWKKLIDEYVHSKDTVSVLEEHGILYILKGHEYFKLRANGSRNFLFEGKKLLGDSMVVFAEVSALPAFRTGGMEFRSAGFSLQPTFRIQPLRPVEELRKEAVHAQPPLEEGEFQNASLIDLTPLDSTIHLDIRYASTNNFLGVPVYNAARAFMQRPAAEALVRAHRWLAQFGYGVLIHDAYRPWYVTKIFWEATPEDKRIFVADPLKGSRHNRGCAVDLSLYDRATGRAVEMTSGYDEFSTRSFPSYGGGTSLGRWHRELLRRAMEQEGFKVYEWEWWHFDFNGWEHFHILNTAFDDIGRSSTRTPVR
jgi:D-alanyl-D-alanine dipeptidase